VSGDDGSPLGSQRYWARRFTSGRLRRSRARLARETRVCSAFGRSPCGPSPQTASESANVITGRPPASASRATRLRRRVPGTRRQPPASSCTSKGPRSATRTRLLSPARAGSPVKHRGGPGRAATRRPSCGARDAIPAVTTVRSEYELFLPNGPGRLLPVTVPVSPGQASEAGDESVKLVRVRSAREGTTRWCARPRCRAPSGCRSAGRRLRAAGTGSA